ncbi:MAG TPA: EamA family transporter, partial [Actinoplanes sp.]|nr:EamA family transporter [Actinoplanes sp.]
MKPLPLLAGAAGMVFVGGSVAVSGELAGTPLLTVQALRYAVASLLLTLVARRLVARRLVARRLVARGLVARGLVRPRGAEWLWLGGVVVTGMFVFNLALVLGA